MKPDVRARVLPWIVGLLPFAFFWLTGLFDVDEGFYGAVIRNMLTSGDWIIPRYRGEPWFEKPILIYWLAAPSVAAFGETFGPRLPSVLASIGTIAISYRFARSHWGTGAASFVPLIFGGALIFVLPGNMLLADPAMTFFLSASFLLLLEEMRKGAGLAWASGGALGLAVLAKGPVSAFIVLAVFVWSYIAEPEYRAQYRKWIVPMVFGSALVAGLWYVPAFLASPTTFIEEFIIRQNLLRLVGGDKAHGVWEWAYIIYYIVVLGVAFAPWWWFGVKGLKGASTVEERWLVRWFFVVLLLFTLSGSKLPHYILPAVVPLGILAAKSMAAYGNSKRILTVGYSMALICAGLTGIGVPIYYRQSGQKDAHDLVKAVRAANGNLWTYQLRPRARSLAPQLKLQEVSLPSIEYYYVGLQEAFDEDDLKRIPVGGYVFTRNGRISSELATELGLRVWKTGYTDRYIVYERLKL